MPFGVEFNVLGVLPESNKEKEGQAIRPKRVLVSILTQKTCNLL